MSNIKLSTEELFCMSTIVRAARLKSTLAAVEEAKKAEDKVQKNLIEQLRKKFGGQVVYCYDESHMNRFATQPPREWNATATSFEECLALTEQWFSSRHDETQWQLIQQQLRTYTRKGKKPTLKEFFVFQAGRLWYCFFSITGDEFCDYVERWIVSQRKEDERRANEPCGCDNYDNL